MPDTLRELIDSAEASGDWDAVADWCEQFDWAQAEGIPAAEFYLEFAAARSNGVSWGRIGEILGVTSEEAQQHYAVSTDAHAAAAP